MRTPRRFLAALLAALLVLAPGGALAAQKEPFEVEEGVLTAYNGPGGAAVVPQGVTAIDGRVFYLRTDLTAVTIPQGVTRVGWCAFGGTGLTSLVLPEGLTQVDYAAFEGCAALGRVALPSTLTALGPRAFARCAQLTSVVLPEALTSIPWGAFAGCAGLTDVVIPPSVVSIDPDAFAGCPDLTIHGLEGSYAQRYALEADLPFVAQEVGTLMAFPTRQVVYVGDTPVAFSLYSVKTLSGQTDYIKLRDLAWALSGTSQRFSVDWRDAVCVTLGRDYVPNGTEMTAPYTGRQVYHPLASPTLVNGVPVTLDAIQLQDDLGQGYTYYRLSDLCAALGVTLVTDGAGALRVVLPQEGVSPIRLQAAATALSLVGKVSYFWGGKSEAIGWDERWGKQARVTARGNETYGRYIPYGMDCTGFLYWTLHNCGLDAPRTWHIGVNLDPVSAQGALPGDVALNKDESHVGLVVGRTAQGEPLICHLGQRNNVVAVDTAEGYDFTRFGRPHLYGD